MRCERKRVDVFRGDVGIDDARVQDGPHFGQTVTLTFRDVKTNGKIEAGAFDFKIPSGADVLQDTH